MVSPRLTVRPANQDALRALQASGIHPLLARLWAARGVTHPDQTKLAWPALLPPAGLTHSAHAAGVLADAIQAGRRLLIVADYDCDGATACAVGLRALSAMGADVDFLVPNRFETGYGLSPAVVDLAVTHRNGKPDIIITVDNGIASVDGVAAANAAGIGVVITDHHLPGDTLPDALAIVNPNQPGCGFPSKNLAGVGVIFYMMLALRAELRRRGVYAADGGPRLDALSDLVALGTVADVVKLDANNRLLVTQGLQRMRAGRLQPGLRALFAVAGREPRSANGFDLGFALGPRINAAGRLADMSLGIACLTTDDEAQALEMARELDNINRERRTIEAEMREQALAAMEEPTRRRRHRLRVRPGLAPGRGRPGGLAPEGEILASHAGLRAGRRRRDPRLGPLDSRRAPARRAGPGIKRHPDLIRKFGGHAIAAGLTLGRNDFAAFAPAFDAAVRELTGRDSFEPVIETDGSLESGYANAEVAGLLQQQVWGGFAAPLFLDEFTVRNQRLVGET